MKINKDCEKIYDDILLQSYVLVVVDVIIFNIVKLIAEYLIINPILTYLVPKTIGRYLTSDDIEINNPIGIGNKNLQKKRFKY